MTRRRSLGILLLLLVSTAASAGETWPQWGGPNRDFAVAERPLSRDWGEDGPKELWSKPLGGGYAAIVTDGKSLYTSFRDGDDEVVVALDPKNGERRWEHRYAAPIPKAPNLSTEYGKGPNGTPLLVDGKVVAFGFMGHVQCLEAKTGKLLWSHSLGDDLDVEEPYFGHATSPLAVGNRVVIVAGGLLAFDLKSGKPAWENREFAGSYGSPILVEAGGKQQIVTPVDGHLAGFDAKSGKTLWTVEHKNQWGTILHMPLVDGAGRVLVSASQVGSKLIDPAAPADKRQVWQDEEFEVGHANVVRRGGFAFSSGGGSVSFLKAMSLADGKLAWKERGFALANLLRVGDDFLLLDHDGVLALLEMDGEGMSVVTKATINDRPSWTVPTLIGTTMYFRDESRIAAFDLSE